MNLNLSEPVFTADEMAKVIASIDEGIRANQQMAYAESDHQESAFFSGAEWALWELRMRIEEIIGSRLGHTEWGEC